MRERSWGLSVVTAMVLLVVLSAPGLWQAVVGLVVSALVGWAVYRRLQVRSWQRELDAAFGTGQRPDVPLHRRL